VLALILLDWERIGRQAVFLIGFIIAAAALGWLMARLSENDRWAVGLIWLAIAGFGADWPDLHTMVGAFLAGVVLDAKWFGHEAMDRLRNDVLLTVMPVFFLSTGLRTQWEGDRLAVLSVAALLLMAVGSTMLTTPIAAPLLKRLGDRVKAEA